MTVTHDDLREIRQQIQALAKRFEAGQQRVHTRLDEIAASLSALARLDERSQALSAGLARHEQCIGDVKRQVADLRERAAWAARIGAGGAAAGGGSIVMAIVRALTS